MICSKIKVQKKNNKRNKFLILFENEYVDSFAKFVLLNIENVILYESDFEITMKFTLNKSEISAL